MSNELEVSRCTPVIEGFVDDMAKVATFGTITIIVFALIIIGFYGLVKEVFAFLI